MATLLSHCSPLSACSFAAFGSTCPPSNPLPCSARLACAAPAVPAMPVLPCIRRSLPLWASLQSSELRASSSAQNCWRGNLRLQAYAAEHSSTLEQPGSVPSLGTSPGSSSNGSSSNGAGAASSNASAASSSSTGTSSTDSGASSAGEPHSGSQPGRAVFRATKFHSRPIEEKQRPLAEYMALPASQYSVLDARRIERLGEDTFRCYVGGLRFFSFTVEPVLTVSVTVQERGPVVRLLHTELQGGKTARAANRRFDARMTNIVRWEEAATAAGGSRQLAITSDTSIEVEIDIPSWFRLVPRGAFEATGSKVMQGVLNSMVPRFLATLQADYERWAAGDASRQPVGDGQL